MLWAKEANSVGSVFMWNFVTLASQGHTVTLFFVFQLHSAAVITA